MALFALLGCANGPRRPQAALHFVTWKPDQPQVWDEAIRRFETTHPGITVTREVGPHSSSAFHDLVTQKLKNRDPAIDVFFIDIVWLAEFAAAGWTLPLDSRFDERVRAQFLAGTIRASTWEGHVHAVPAFIDAGMLYYRKDLLEKYHLPAPRTWSELAAAARRIVAGEHDTQPGLAGYSGQFKQYEGLVCNLLEFVAAHGGRFVDEQATHATLSEPATLAAIRWVRDEVIGGLAPRSVLTYQEPESLALFVQGLAVFHRNWPYAWDVSNDERASRVAGKVGIAPLPGFDDEAGRSALGGWLYGVSAYSRRADSAWAFVDFMTSEETQRHFALHASLAPTRSALYEDPAVAATGASFVREKAAFRGAVPRPVTPMYPAVSGALQRFLSTAIATRDSDLDRLAAQADSEIDRYLELAR